MEAETFSFYSQIPAELAHTTYCFTCYEKTIVPGLEKYNQTMEAAKEIAVYFHDQGKESRLIKRDADPVQVNDCPDRNETLLRLAFFAAQNGYNAMVDVRLTGLKVKSGSRQSQIWSGQGIPAHVDPSKIIKDRSFWSNPN